MTGLFNGAFPKRTTDRQCLVFYGQAILATSINSLWLRCVAAPPIEGAAALEYNVPMPPRRAPVR